jgi:magnesium-transporting ATPase (P-type)
VKEAIEDYVCIRLSLSSLALSPFTLVLLFFPASFPLQARYKMDKALNNNKVKVWRTDHFEDTTWQSLSVGDLVHVAHDQPFPADILVLKTSTPTGSCSIETSQLDGFVLVLLSFFFPSFPSLPSFLILFSLALARAFTFSQ